MCASATVTTEQGYPWLKKKRMFLAMVFSSIHSLPSFSPLLPLAISDDLCPPHFSILDDISQMQD